MTWIECADPDAFRGLSDRFARDSELWIDTEVADWQTSAPRLALLQVRTADGTLHIIDMLAPGMRDVLETRFIPRVMANETIRKWAHSAGFERRYLGLDAIRNLQCTLQLARSIPFHRLQMKHLTLAALVRRLCGDVVDKSPQKSDWGRRPLSDEQMRYAAADPEWCFRIQEKLAALAEHVDPALDDPSVIDVAYRAILPDLRRADARKKAIRDAVLLWAADSGKDSLGSFRIHARAVTKTFLADLIRVATELDPGRTLDLALAVPKALRGPLPDVVRDELRARCSIAVTRTFRGPRAPGRDALEVYSLPSPPDAVDEVYRRIDHDCRVLRSRKEELRDRMRSWLLWKQMDAWGDFRFSAPEERWSADLRDLGAVAEAAPDYVMAVPQRFRLAFGGGTLERMRCTDRVTPVVTWRERAADDPLIEVQETRDWHEAVED